jgi:hypothetical protein
MKTKKGCGRGMFFRLIPDGVTFPPHWPVGYNNIMLSAATTALLILSWKDFFMEK